jgi:DICT domain-containing protein
VQIKIKGCSVFTETREIVAAMNDFSMLEQASRIVRSSCVKDLGAVSYISRKDFDTHETFKFRAQVPCLEYISLLIENALLLRTNRTGRIYVGFEKLSRMEGVIDRYMRIADLSERVYVFGEADWKPPRHPNMKVIALKEGSKLTREWFVIADSPTLRVAMIAIDEDGFDAPILDQRNFSAFKISDSAMVAQLAAMTEKLIDATLSA